MVRILKIIYKGLLTLDATILLVFIYAVKCQWYIGKIGEYSIILYILGILLITFICLACTRALSEDSIGKSTEISSANDSYMPNYLGYFFVALSIPENEYLLFGIVYFIICVFTYFSQSLYFNPLFLIFRYNFYYITSENHLKVMVISKRNDVGKANDIAFDKLRRINNFTFIDMRR